MDSFSGYSILRSDVLRELLREEKIRLDCQDDGADYLARVKALKSSKTQMAVFTIDSLLTAGEALGEFPASIVLVLDETQGADGMVAWEAGVSNIQDLDDPEARIVCTPESPSEFLARIVLADFSLPSLPANWMIEADGAEAVYKELRNARKDQKRAYVMWEPYVTKAVEDGAKVLLDSKNLDGYIVDVLVVEREFLRERPEVVSKVVECYLRAAYSYSSRQGAMEELVRNDAKAAGDALTEAQAAKLVQGIHWKNTLENYGHFGIRAGLDTGAVPLLEDVIPNITRVLIQTKKLDHDPLEGRPNRLYYDRVLSDLQGSGFDPARKTAILNGVDRGPSGVGEAKHVQTLPKLSEAQWGQLMTVGEMRIPPIAFGRGNAPPQYPERAGS